MKRKNMKKRALVSLALIFGSAAGLAVAPKDTFVMQINGTIATTDPHQAYDTNVSSYFTNVYDTLVTFEGKSTKIVPMLATAWKTSSDLKTFTLTLRKGVKFHSGNDFTCVDAEYSLRRLISSSNGLSAGFYLSGPLLGFGSWDDAAKKSTTFANVSKAVRCDANGNLILETPKQEPLLMARLTGTHAAIIDSKFAIENGEWDGTEATWKDLVGKDLSNSAMNKADAGSGAYQMVSREADQMVFKAFPGYWGEKSKFENVVMKVVPTDASRVLAMKNGDADFVAYDSVTSIAQLRGAPGVKILELKSTAATAIYFNPLMDKKSKFIGSGKLDGKGIPVNFFGDIHVRRAFAASFNSARVLKEILQGSGELRTMALSSLLPGYDPSIKLPAFDPELAKREFKLAFKGELWKKGFAIELLTIAETPVTRDVFALLKQDLEKLNPKFKAILRPTPQNDLYAALGGNLVPITINGTSADVPDGESLAQFSYSSTGTFSVHTHYNDPITEKAFAALAATADPVARGKQLTAIGRRGAELLLVLPLPEVNTFKIFRKEVKGVDENFNIFRYTSLFWNSLSK